MLRRRCSVSRSVASVRSRSPISCCSSSVRAATACSTWRVRPVIASRAAASSAAAIMPAPENTHALPWPTSGTVFADADSRNAQRRPAKGMACTCCSPSARAASQPSVPASLDSAPASPVSTRQARR